ncbi:hypothetical protein AVEN_134172-1 [Araneus ventricosus]|uniref:Uncharacterized protein n=1 Tax=Araneus ventricosus TaxID=182803 RepID=A0A4Y2GSI0_ARAVE|nr:hypothetical protein AVEN_18332-1 [Araneus ventricosus]GBM56640.1 hypothetical protein AVEN_39527-1 [Araneus ventricosus]GBM56651.1 hypothetical protein AVEN_56732-1 [Araneus ventricosus]GBM56700.1 hypothetical protein AVEN_134172-1 [Araneus ventricosus]
MEKASQAESVVKRYTEFRTVRDCMLCGRIGKSSPSDYRLFPILKEYLGGHRLQSNEDIKTTVQSCLNLKDTTFSESCIDKLV